MTDKFKKGLQNWLQIQPVSPYHVSIQSFMDFETAAIRNRIWYRADGNELEQLYQQCRMLNDAQKFWGAKPTAGMEIRKIHTGLPGLIVKMLSAIVLPDMNAFEFDSDIQKNLWEEIEEENHFEALMDTCLKDTLVVGDGAFRIILDPAESEHPIIEWVPGERVEFVYRYGRLKEVIFKIPWDEGGVLHAHYGRGYIRHKLYRNEQEYPLPKEVQDWTFDESLMMAVPFKIYENAKYEGRGSSIYDGKLDSFDALDEAWSQWMDALRAGRSKTYVPESFIPRDPNNGMLLKPNAFDNRFIAGADDISEGAKNAITVTQPNIPHDSYMASYITALDLCLQGIISPSTLGIDTKKLDNALAQREKEKTTLYTRASIVKAVQEQLPRLIQQCINAEKVLRGEGIEEVKVNIPFGEYASPSFESQVETLAKARPGVAMMSIEAQIEELYGDTKDEEWKKEEVARLKEEQGISSVEEPDFSVEEGIDGSPNIKPQLQNGPGGIQADA